MGLTKKAAYAVGMIRKHGLWGLAIKVMETKYELAELYGDKRGMEGAAEYVV